MHSVVAQAAEIVQDVHHILAQASRLKHPHQLPRWHPPRPRTSRLDPRVQSEDLLGESLQGIPSGDDRSCWRAVDNIVWLINR